MIEDARGPVPSSGHALGRRTPGRALALLALVSGLLPAFPASAEQAPDRVRITGGLIEAAPPEDPAIRVFRGVPFAAAPVGDRRWKAPAPVVPWEGVRKADTWGARCMQGEMFGGPLITRDREMSEDCLYLNVWAPADPGEGGLPVLFVLHGGGFAAGSASEPRTGGEWFARQGIVVVAANYRLGLFGFLAHPELSAQAGGRGSGNYGMLDQVAALEWVRENIAAFGGDPDRVTINGESAGSFSVSALMASPLSKHLVHGAIGQSGAFFPAPGETLRAKPLAEKERDGVRFAEAVGAASIAELRARDAEALLAAAMRQSGGWGYAPGVDGHFLPRPVPEIYAAGEQAPVPLLAGWTSSELGMTVAMSPEAVTRETHAGRLREVFGARADEAMALYGGDDREALLQSAADLAGDLFVAWSTWKWVEAHHRGTPAPVWRYRFDRALPDDPASRFGALHASDIEYAFHQLDTKQAPWREADREVSRVMATAFANFVRHGDPNGPGVPSWPEFGASGRVMILDADSVSVPEPHRDRHELIDAVAGD